MNLWEKGCVDSLRSFPTPSHIKEILAIFIHCLLHPNHQQHRWDTLSPPTKMVFRFAYLCSTREGGREGGRKGGRGREGAREGGREAGRERGSLPLCTAYNTLTTR